MENQTRFDLDNALRVWREDCASRPGISAEDARELESDLRERVEHLRKQGLSENEAFREAVHQVGPPSALAQEFARENPLEIWRERLLWMVAAGFAVAVWHLMTSGAIVWFAQKFGVLCLASFTDSLCILAIAVLLATGRFEMLGGYLQCLLRNRQQLGIAGMGLIVLGVLTRFFGPNPISLPRSAGLAGLLVLNMAAWPLLLLTLGIFLFRPVCASDLGSLEWRLAVTPGAVWRERLRWMAIGGLMVGFWETVSWVCMKALFYTGDINASFNGGIVCFAPFNGGRRFFPIYLLIQICPVLVIGLLLRQRIRSGKSITGTGLIRRPVLFLGIPAFVCAWTCFYVWSEYLWMPRESGVSFPAFVSIFLGTFRWVWPVGLTALLLWLMPEVSKRQSSEFAE